MHTRCPACTTTFRVSLEQLKVRQGKVRCGRCQNVFDALENLVEPLAALVASPVSDTEDSAAPPAAAPASLVAPAVDVDAPTAPPAADEAIPPSTPKRGHSPLTAPVPVRVQRAVRWPWSIGIIVALGGLLLQSVLYWRVDLATRYPEYRPTLELLCEQMGCTVGLPAEVARLKIEHSDLHPGPKGRLELKALLRNLAPFEQQWPQLELTLTDAADRSIARKVLGPAEYLPPESPTAFPAEGEIAVQVYLDVSALPAAGYRLYLFYP